MSDFADLIPEFVEESMEHLKNIEEDIIQIESGTDDKELINRVFRAVHSVKGGSSFLGLKNIERLSHKMEDIFNLVRNGELHFNAAISSAVLQSIDTLKEMLERVEESESIPIERNLNALERCLAGHPAGPGAEKMQFQVNRQPIQIDKYRFTTYKKQGKRIFHIRIELKESASGFKKNPLEFFKEFEKLGEIIDSYVDMERVMYDESFKGEGVPLSIIYATVLEKDLVVHHFTLNERDVAEIGEHDLGESAPVAAAAAPKQEEEEVSEVMETLKVQTPATVEAVGAEDDAIDVIQDQNEFLTFFIDEEEYGIDIHAVNEIVTLMSTTPIPNSEPYTCGITNLRGDIIPVYDFRRRMDFSQIEYHAQTIVLVLRINEKKFGVVVDRVSEVLQLTREQILEAPTQQQIPSEYLLGIGQKDGKFIFLLKISEIFKINEAA